MSKRIHVRYYALLREQRGCSEEIITTSAYSPSDLYKELQEIHPFSLKPDVLKIALNDAFASWNDELKDNDTIVFIPPVAGG